jgi:hypothetical protein
MDFREAHDLEDRGLFAVCGTGSPENTNATDIADEGW